MTKVSRLCILIFVSGFLLSRVAEAQSDQTQRWKSRPPTGSFNDSTADLSDRDNMLGTAPVIEGTVTPDKYIVGPGDGFLITIWGPRNEHFRQFISPEGKILIPQVGEIQADGLTITKLRERLAEEIARVFFDARVDATLIQLRHFRVYVLGDVWRPGGYAARVVDRVDQLVDRAGGLLPTASSRSIEILRDGKIAELADLQKFRVEGSLHHNPYVRDGDVLLVRPRTAEVSVHGAVWVPRDVEFRQGDTIAEAIHLARGMRPEAFRSEVELVRFNKDQLTTNSQLLDLGKPDGADWQIRLERDDRLYVRAIPEWHKNRSVLIKGEVKYPGQYVILKDSTRLTDVINLAGGVTDDASLFESYLIRPDTTVMTDPEYERLKLMGPANMTPTEYEYYKMRSRDRPGVIVVDFQRLLENEDRTENIFLKHGDQILITRNRQMIIVTGQVASPGAVTYDPVLGVDDYIEKAGGYGWNARKNKTRVIRAKTGEWLRSNRVASLGPGDTIWVPEKPYHDWWSLFLQGLTTAGQVATLILVIETIAN